MKQVPDSPSPFKSRNHWEITYMFLHYRAKQIAIWVEGGVGYCVFSFPLEIAWTMQITAELWQNFE